MNVAIAVLAAGCSSRAAGQNKLLACPNGQPLVALAAQRALASSGRPVMVVVGHMEAEIRKALAEIDAMVVQNPAYQTGISSSIQAAVALLPLECDGLMIHLADMPMVTQDHRRRLLDTFNESVGKSVVRATAVGLTGNPVILPRSLFSELSRLRGDAGARRLIETRDISIADVEIGDAARFDAGTLETLSRLGEIADGSATEKL